MRHTTPRSTFLLFLAAMFVLGVVPTVGIMGGSGSIGVAYAAGPYTIWPGAVTPGFTYDNPAPVEVGLRFRSDVSGYVTGVRFFKAAGATGTHIGRLWTNGGVKLAEVPFTNETASGWQSATFPTAVAIQASTTYMISYYLGDGNHRFSDTFDFFATTGVDSPPLHALRDGVDGSNGSFSDTGGWFNQTYRSSNYWVDVIFDDTAPPPDVIPPTVSSVIPVDTASGVLISSNVSAIFSEAMASSTIDVTTFELRDASSNLVTASIVYASGSYTATLDPGSDLAYDTIYTARVKSGSSGVMDLAGNALVADYTWTFTTEAPDLIPPTVSSVVPANGTSGVLISSSVSAAFSEAMAAGTVGGATFELRDASNNLVPASVSYAPGSYTATLDPGTDLGYNTIYTALVKGGSSGVQDLAGNPLATDYTWTFTTETPDVTPPTVSSVMPINGVTKLRPATRTTARFSEAMDTGTITATGTDATFELRDASNTLVPATVAYDAGTLSATLTPSSDLAHNTTYTARVKGGATGVKDLFGNAMTVGYTWSFGIVAERPPVDQAPGGPILVIASSANLYTRYFTEILRTEGLNEFDLSDIADVTVGMLAAHDVVILGDMALSTDQVSLLTAWVEGGGHLIAMRPDKQLAGLLGLTDAASTLSNGYLLIDTSRSPGTGIVGQTLQFHGTADAYTLSGATGLASLYSDRATLTPYPAVTMRSVGSYGGVACAFTFDLARSIIYTHQGNPAWQINHVNPLQTYGTALDLFYPDWIDFNRITIPQADEQQRFLANLILYTNVDKKPLPRFWYLPKGKKAAIILTGDDHWGRSSPSGSSKIFFDRHQAQSPAGCSADDWECVRSSSYGYEGCLLTDAEAAAYTAQGFEFGLHADAGLASGSGWCGTWPSDMPAQYGGQFETLMRKYASLPVQGSERSHCYSWFGYTGASGWQGYAGTPEVEADLGLRFDTNISYNPAGWGTVNPGYQMGSGMMMRFAQVDNSGVMTKFLDIYNGGTQMNDDNGQGAAAMRGIVDSFLDNAKGPQGYYGGFVVNMHSDNWYGWSYDGSDQVVASAQAHDIPVVSGTQMSDWLDGRNSSSFGSIGWDGTTMAFTVAVGAGARNLMGMLPSRVGIVPLGTLTRNGSDVSFTRETIKGVEYAFFPAVAGTYAATYAPDLTPPVISAVAADPASGQTATITWTTNEPATSRVDYGTDPGALGTGAPDGMLVGQHTVHLTGLLPNTIYYYRVVSADESGNTATLPATSSDPAYFTTPSASFIDMTVADFSAGSPDAGLYISQMADGEVILAPAVATEFPGTSLPSGWAVLQGTGTAVVSGGVLTLNGSTVGTTATYAAGHSVEAVATFTAGMWQHVGFGVTYQTDSGQAWAMISTGATGAGLSARCWTGSGAYDTQITPISGSFFGAPHRYRVDWNDGSIDYYVDGVKVATHSVTITTPMRPLFSVGSISGPSLTVDSAYLTPYAGTGVFTSRVFDARGPATWQGLSWTSDIPAATSLAMSARTGNVRPPDGSWTAFTSIASSGGTIGGTSRYVQYQATLSTGDLLRTAMLRDVSIGYLQTEAPPPEISAISVDPIARQTATINWATDVPATSRVEYGTGAGSLAMSAADLTLTQQHAITLTGLLPGTQYYCRVISADGSGQATTAPAAGTDPATFTTLTLSFMDRTVADFSAGSPDANLYLSLTADGEVILTPTVATEFSGLSLPSGWSESGSGTATVGNGVIVLNGATVGPAGTYSAGHSVEAVATFSAGIHQHVGFGVTLTATGGDAWAIISTGAAGTGLLARCWTGSGGFDTQSTPISGSYLGAPHRYRVDWNTSSIDYYVDGVKVATHNVAIATPMRPLLSVGPVGAMSLTVDWLHMSPYATPGVFTSRTFDAGGPALWQGMSWTSDLPTGTTLSMSARTGDVPVPDATWTTFTPIETPGGTIGGTSRCVQYQAAFSTSDPALTPTLRDVTIQYGVGSTEPPAAPTAIAAGNIGTGGFTANWNVVEGATSYRLDVATDAGFSGMLPSYSDLTVSGLFQAVSGLSSGTAYCYRVRAVNGNGPSIASNTITVTTTATDLVAAQPPSGAVISSAHVCVTVPVVFTRVSATPVRGYSVTVRLTGNLALCGGGGGIVEGPYLQSQSGSTVFQVTNHHDGSYTVDCAILGSPCGVTGSGTLFTVGIGSGDPGGSGTVTVTAAAARDCGNAPVPGIPGPAATIPIDNVGPAAASALTAARVQSGNGTGGTTKVAVSFTVPDDGAVVEVYRAPYGNYPEYDDGTNPGAEPSAPTYPPGAPWVRTLIAASGQSDEVASRDVWYYAVFVKDAAGNTSAGARSAGALNYHLGDVSNGTIAGTGNNAVFDEDISLLGAHYGATLGANDPLGYLDVGPTSDGWIDGRPMTDNLVEFEDLVMFGLNYAAVSKASPRPAAAAIDELVLEVPALVQAGEMVDARVRMRGTGMISGLSIALTWDPLKLTPTSVTAGDLASANGAVLLSPGPGVADATVLGTATGGITGSGDLAVFRFRALADGAANIAIDAVKARDGRNRAVTLPFTTTRGPSAPTPPTVTQLSPAQPNPFTRTSTISFSLAEAGAIELSLYAANGARVRTLARGAHEPGVYTLTWDGRDDGNAVTAAGVYYLRLTTARGNFSRRIVCIR